MTIMTEPAPSAADLKAERERAAAEVAEGIRKVADPTERFAAAAEIWQRATARCESARGLRDMATIVAHLDDGEPPVRLYRDVLQVSRGLFVRIIQRAPSQREKMSDTLAQARESAEAVRRHQATIDAVRPILHETALMLMSGYDDPKTGERVMPMTNADIARATGLSTARVAQIRTGKR